MLKLLFWISAAYVVYIYFGYAILLRLLQPLFRRSYRVEPIEPSVSLLIAAYNEEAVIANKLRNALALDYPADRLEIVVASDGSKDNTAAIVRSFAEGEGRGRIRLLDFSPNRGKIAVLNDAVPKLSGEIVAFSDASTMLAADSLRCLARHFADPRIGAVSGVYRVLKKEYSQLGVQEDFYWKYETFLKIQESRLGAFTGAHGSLYAIRRLLYPFPPLNTINDDFVIPMRIQAKGYGIGYEPAAVAYEEAHEMEGFSRRVRISAGNVEQLREIKGLIWPLQPLALFCLLSHKAGRLLVPVAMVTTFLANALLVAKLRPPAQSLYPSGQDIPDHPYLFNPYLWLLIGQILFYVLALLGKFFTLRPKFLRLPYYFCMINSALFAWMYYALRMRRAIPSRVELDQITPGPSAS
jgi:cellulose synthase/poly-beta-1,6-N-acetylglucosamine synthase-like glycosyltransferase